MIQEFKGNLELACDLMTEGSYDLYLGPILTSTIHYDKIMKE